MDDSPVICRQVQLMKYRLRERRKRKRNTHREWRTVEKDDFWLHNCCYVQSTFFKLKYECIINKKADKALKSSAEIFKIPSI